MEFLAPLHPQIVHAPIALIIVAAVFEIIGRAVDLAWWRKAAFAMLIVGVLGAGLAVLSGREAGERAEERQGVPEEAVDAHEEIAVLAMWLGVAAVVMRAVAGRLGPARGAASGLALLLHLGTAVTVGIAAHRGGMLVREHGASVRLHGRLLISGPRHAHEEEEAPSGKGERREEP
jgi:uncharacterized membrane protein